MSRPSPRTTAQPCLPLGIKESLKEGVKILAFGPFDFGFWTKGGFLMWEALEGKRIAEGKVDC
jgi:hypothetical protein